MAEETVLTPTTISKGEQSTDRKLSEILPCQQLEQSFLIKGTSEIQYSYKLSPKNTDPADQELTADYFQWSIGRAISTDG